VVSETGLRATLLEAPAAPRAAGVACAAAAVLAGCVARAPAGFLTRTCLTAVLLGAAALSVLAAAAPVEPVGLSAPGPDGEVGPGEGAGELPGDRLLVLLRLPEAADAAESALVAAALPLLACESKTATGRTIK
jgi:hypothetical protein